MPKPEEWGKSEGEPLVRSWGQTAVILNWKLGSRGSSQTDAGILGKRTVCEETGAELDPLLPSDFVANSLEGLLSMLAAGSRAERESFWRRIVPPEGASSRSVRRKVADIVRILDARLSLEEQALDAEEAGLRAEIERVRNEGARRGEEISTVRAMAESDMLDKQLDERVELGIALAAAKEKEHNAAKWLAEAEDSLTLARAGKAHVEAHLELRRLEAQRLSDEALEEQQERHRRRLTLIEARLASTQEVVQRAHANFERVEHEHGDIASALEEEVGQAQADIEGAEAAARRADAGLKYSRASAAHQAMREEELAGLRGGLESRLRALEVIRANLEKVVQAHPGRKACSTVQVVTTFPSIALADALDGGLQQRVMGLLAAAACPPGQTVCAYTLPLPLLHIRLAPHDFNSTSTHLQISRPRTRMPRPRSCSLVRLMLFPSQPSSPRRRPAPRLLGVLTSPTLTTVPRRAVANQQQLVARGWEAGPDRRAVLSVLVLPPFEDTAEEHPGTITDRIRSKFWRTVLASQVGAFSQRISA